MMKIPGNEPALSLPATNNNDPYGEVNLADTFGLTDLIKSEQNPSEYNHNPTYQAQHQKQLHPSQVAVSPPCNDTPTITPNDVIGQLPAPPIASAAQTTNSSPRKRGPYTKSANSAAISGASPSKKASVPKQNSNTASNNTVNSPASSSVSVHNTDDPDIAVQYSFICGYCPFITAHKTSCRRHINTTHSSVPGVDPTKMTEKELFLCKRCKFNSNHRTSAKRHVRTIHKDDISPLSQPVGETTSASVGSQEVKLEASI